MEAANMAKSSIEVQGRCYDVVFETYTEMNGVPEDREHIVMRVRGTNGFIADDFLKTLGLEVRDGDTVSISAKVVERTFISRRAPSLDDE
jgi:hypothetical protein